MKYSVLMSVYKKDNPFFLKTALKSIYEMQTRKPDEIVIVFDGPLTDELHNVLNEFRSGKEGVVFFYPQNENKGLGEALKVGTQYCTGDYIFRMDADDISDSRRFEKQCAYVESHPEIDVLGTDISEFDIYPDENMRVRACPKRHDDIVRMGKKRTPMNHVSVCIKKKALTEAGGYENLLLLEDYYLWLRMIVAGCRFENINESLVYVRVGNGFADRRGSRKIISGWRVIQNYMVEHKIITRLNASVNMLYIRVFVSIPSGMKKSLYKVLLRKKQK